MSPPRVDLDGFDGRRPMPRAPSKGTNRGHWHTTSKRVAQGAARLNGGFESSPRVATSLLEADFRRLVAIAQRRGVTVAAILRDAVAAYLGGEP